MDLEIAAVRQQIAALKAEMLQEEDLTEQGTALESRDSLVQPLSDEPGGDSSDQLDITAEDDRNDETFGGSAMPAQPSPDVETFGGEACHEDRGDYINDETFGEDAQNEVTFRSVDADQAPQWGDSSHALSALAQAFESERTQEADAASGEGGGDAGAGGEGSEAGDTSSSFVHVGSGDDGVLEQATADRHDVDLLEQLRLWAQSGEAMLGALAGRGGPRLDVRVEVAISALAAVVAEVDACYRDGCDGGGGGGGGHLQTRYVLLGDIEQRLQDGWQPATAGDGHRYYVHPNGLDIFDPAA